MQRVKYQGKAAAGWDNICDLSEHGCSLHIRDISSINKHALHERFMFVFVSYFVLSVKSYIL